MHDAQQLNTKGGRSIQQSDIIKASVVAFGESLNEVRFYIRQEA